MASHFIDDINPAIVYSDSLYWIHHKSENGSNVFNNTYTAFDTGVDDGVILVTVSLSFHGTGIALWLGGFLGWGDNLACKYYIDNDTAGSNCMGVAPQDGPQGLRAFEKRDLVNSDHFIRVEMHPRFGGIDGFEIYTQDGEDPLRVNTTGINLENVPEEAIRIDGDDMDHITFDDLLSWGFSNSTVQNLRSPRSFELEFEGTAIWWYAMGSLVFPVANITVMIDGQVVQSDPVPTTEIATAGALSWMKVDLGVGEHVMNVTVQEGSTVQSEYFRVLQSGINTLSITDEIEPSASVVSDGDSPKVNGLMIGLVVAVVFFGSCVFAGLIYYLLKRRRNPNQFPDPSYPFLSSANQSSRSTISTMVSKPFQKLQEKQKDWTCTTKDDLKRFLAPTSANKGAMRNSMISEVGSLESFENSPDSRPVTPYDVVEVEVKVGV